MSQAIERPFPFCPVESAAVGDGTLHPFGTDLLGTIDIYRKVKLWQVEIETSWATYLFSDLQFSQDGFGVGAAVSEFDLACAILQGDFNHYRLAGTFEGVPPPEISIAFEILLFCEFVDPAIVLVSIPPPATETDSLRSDSGSYYPQLFFGATAFNDDVTGTTEDVSTYNDSVATPAAATCFVNGNAVQLYSNASGNIVSIVLAPQEYWEYRPTSGGDAILNSATGAQINPNVIID